MGAVAALAAVEVIVAVGNAAPNPLPKPLNGLLPPALEPTVGVIVVAPPNSVVGGCGCVDLVAFVKFVAVTAAGAAIGF